MAIDDKTKLIRRHIFVDTIEELEAATQDLHERGLGVFFALSAFSADERKADKSTALRAFFIDIDVGPPVTAANGKVKTKAYPDTASAAKALRVFVDQAKLPKPLIVASGGGIHAYWPFTADVPTGQWGAAASAFKTFCLTSKLGIDPQVTADAARVLRVPGTTNRKLDEDRPVQIVLQGDGPTPFEEFVKLIPMPTQAPDLSSAKAFLAEDAATAALAAGDRKPSRFSLILERDRCAQLTYAATDAAALDEPMWRAALSVAWNCTDAETAITAVSAGHPGYTPEATLHKAQKLTDKPYTCAWFRENYPQRCEGCTSKVTSPIQLGTFVAEASTADDGGYEVEADLNPDNDPISQPVKIKIPELPWPYFRADTGGIFKRVKDEDGNDLEPIEVYPQDLYISNRFYDSDEHGDGDGELVTINLHLPHDGVRRFHATVVNLLTKDKLRDVLVKHGVIAYGKKLDTIMAYLAESFKKLQSKYASNKTRSQMGWTPEGHFVVGELEYTPSGVVLAPSASGTRQLAPLFYAKGTVEGWREVIDFYNREGMEGHAFGFLVGMGSCLLRLLNSTQVRGAVLNLVSNGSGTGKTTVQMAINSVFGHPVELLMVANDTAASRFHRLGTLNSICMTVDELTTASGEQLSALVYGSTSGRAPHRMEASSNKLRNNQTSWCSVTVTSSNAVMADALAAHRTAVEGELKRVIDLPITIPTHISKAESDALFSKLADNFGVAGPVFIQHVVANRDAVETALKDMQMRIDREAGFERNDRFYSAVCTLAIVAGLIGNKLGLFELDLKRIYKFAISSVRDIRDSNAAVVGNASSMATEMMAKFIGENIDHIVIIESSKKGEPTAPLNTGKFRGPLKMRYEPDTDELLVLAADLREYFVSRRVDFKASIQEFLKMGALKPSAKGETSNVRRIAAGVVGSLTAPAARCYVFKGAMLGVKLDAAADGTPAE